MRNPQALWFAKILGKFKLTCVSRTKFVKCDTTNWEDQLEMFRTAASFSDDGRISYVVANAGIARADDVFSFSGNCHQPQPYMYTPQEENLH